MTIAAVLLFIVLPLIGLGLLLCAVVFYSQVRIHRRLERERGIVDIRRE